MHRGSAAGRSLLSGQVGASIDLDPTTTLETITSFALFEARDDVLVSPVGHLIAARTRWKVIQLGDVLTAHADAAEHLNRHLVPGARVPAGRGRRAGDPDPVPRRFLRRSLQAQWMGREQVVLPGRKSSAGVARARF